MAKATCWQRISEAMARLELLHTGKFGVNKGAGGYRLTDAYGGREYSPRLPGAAFALWLEAFEVGINLASATVLQRLPDGSSRRTCGACGTWLPEGGREE